MSRILAVILDLDNVLYDEREYFLAAFHNIARYLSKRYHLSEQKIYRELAKNFRKKSSMYPKLFNDLLDDFELSQQILPNLLDVFASTKTNLKLRTSAEEVLINLKKQGLKLGLLTNGTVKVQVNKVQLLGVGKYFDSIVYARILGKENEKPNPNAYLSILKTLNVEPKLAICIGDNPYTDFWGAKKLGVLTVRLLQGEFKKIKLNEEYEADINVQSLNEFYKFLKKLSLNYSNRLLWR